MEEKNVKSENAFKSKLVERLLKKYQRSDLSKDEIKNMPKDNNAINLSDILSEIGTMTPDNITDIILDIKNYSITIDINFFLS